MVIKKTISIQDYILERAMEKVRLLHGNNFSSYVSNLISRDINDEPIRINEKKKKKDANFTSAIDDILNMKPKEKGL